MTSLTRLFTRSMSSKIYIGNLSWNTTDDSLKNAFQSFGQITDSIVLKDRVTGRSRGFGFITFSSEESANAACSAMNEGDLDGRQVRCNLAEDKPREDRPDRNSFQSRQTSNGSNSGNRGGRSNDQGDQGW